MSIDTCRIGWRSSAYALARSAYARGIPLGKRPAVALWAARRLRNDLARLRAGGHRCGGWHAEPEPMPPGVGRIGCAWTRRGALCDLGRHLLAALGPPPQVIGRAVVADGYAQGRADLQLVHGHREPETLGELFADAVPPIPTERRGVRFSVPEEWNL